MVNKKIGYISPIAIHPCEVIKDTLEYLGMSQVDLSLRTGLSEKTISLVLNGKEPVTPETALKLERVLDLDQKMLVSIQARYWADKSRIEEKERLNSEVKFLKDYSCYNEMAQRGYVEKTTNSLVKVEELLKFFNVNSLGFVPDIMGVSFRRSVKGKIDDYSLASWLRIGEIEANKREIGSFDKGILKRNVDKMRSLTKESSDVFLNQLVELCAEAGVKLVFVPHFKKTKVNGATYWISKENPLIQLSLFNKYADIFWFTLFHEIGHILKHGKKESFIELENGGSSKQNKEEEEANVFAQKILIGNDKIYQDFKKNLNTANIKTEIIKFADQIDIEKGIVAGRIGKELEAWRYVSGLRNKLVFNS
ncbi:MAG: ImmA/IrrE family metallo-endopeptidase [Patescibacteria group bacterium]|nr:ImmA/IrrE family metallo-endopeptidase [Patescibacteria group bacterium]